MITNVCHVLMNHSVAHRPTERIGGARISLIWAYEHGWVRH